MWSAGDCVVEEEETIEYRDKERPPASVWYFLEKSGLLYTHWQIYPKFQKHIIQAFFGMCRECWIDVINQHLADILCFGEGIDA